MKLREFVRSTLIDILGGISDAQDEIASSGKAIGTINPRFTTRGELKRDIEFDVAITVEESTTDSARGGINVVALDLGGKIESLQTSSNVSRVRFAVPVIGQTIDTRN